MQIKSPKQLFLIFGSSALALTSLYFTGRFAFKDSSSTAVAAAPQSIALTAGGYAEAFGTDNQVANKYSKVAQKTGYKERYPQISESEMTSRDGQKLVKDAATAFDSMRAAARRDGVSIKILSGYRSIATQVGLFENKIKKFKSEIRAADYSAPPGHSQHHTGLALDLNSLSPSFRNTKEYRWLKNNAPKYGFMLSYENNESKCDLGPHNEPWHWVYVGKPAALSLMQEFIARAKQCGYDPEKP
jgi:LAS superfamily LD-carboxypeptidase LdcB